MHSAFRDPGTSLDRSGAVGSWGLRTTKQSRRGETTSWHTRDYSNNVNLDLLLVEPSEATRYRMRLLLRDCGARVETVHSAEQALNYLADTRPDAVFANRVLPGMNGLELLELFRLSPSTQTLPMVLFGADMDWPLARSARAQGAKLLPLSHVDTSIPELLAKIAGEADIARPQMAENPMETVMKEGSPRPTVVSAEPTASQSGPRRAKGLSGRSVADRLSAGQAGAGRGRAAKKDDMSAIMRPRAPEQSREPQAQQTPDAAPLDPASLAPSPTDRPTRHQYSCCALLLVALLTGAAVLFLLCSAR